MNQIEERVLDAQVNQSELKALVSDYMPFIKKQLKGVRISGMDYEDLLSVAALVFVMCVRTYKKDSGSFLTYTGRCIQNRFVDLWRKESRYVIADGGSAGEGEEPLNLYEFHKSLENYSREEEKKAIAEEIERFTCDLKQYGITIAELVRISPKQERARKQCYCIAGEIMADEGFKNEFKETGRIPRQAVAGRFNISVKTIEKHRKYIVCLCVLNMGDYPLIQSYIPDKMVTV